MMPALLCKTEETERLHDESARKAGFVSLFLKKTFALP
jgi:hypothetical protein